MQFEWVKGSTVIPSITIYDNNVTLNNAAANYFNDCKYALLGIDNESAKIAIKPIKRRELELNIYENTNLNKVSIGKGYARISNKYFIDQVNKHMQRDMQGTKFEAKFDEKEGMLIIDLKEGEISL